jgi:hypothetical protein
VISIVQEITRLRVTNTIVMRERQDFTGQKFGRLTVIGTEIDEKGKSLQVCRCECGTVVKIHSYRIKNGSTVSCGCHSREKAKERMTKEGAEIARKYQLSKPMPVHPGDVFGLLTVIKETDLIPDGEGQRNRRAVLCKCECGKEVPVRVKDLMEGRSVSCGCYRAIGAKRTHGQSANRAHKIPGTSEYNSWLGCINRCYNPISKGFLEYGLFGITVCDRWRQSFSVFYADMGPKPFPEYSLDRYPDPKGNYEPSNCRWASPSEQASNRIYLSYDEKTDRVCKVSLHMAQQYLIRSKRSEEEIRMSLIQIRDALFIKPE